MQTTATPNLMLERKDIAGITCRAILLCCPQKANCNCLYIWEFYKNRGLWRFPKNSFVRVFINVSIFIVQCAAAFLTGLFIYMMFALLDYSGGLQAFIGLAIFQPIMGGILCAISILICLIAGLPIRFGKLRSWWGNHFIIPIAGIITGLLLLSFSITPMFIESVTILEEGEEITRKIPNEILALSGWFLLLFSILHILPPENTIQKMEALVLRLFRK